MARPPALVCIVALRMLHYFDVLWARAPIGLLLVLLTAHEGALATMDTSLG